MPHRPGLNYFTAFACLYLLFFAIYAGVLDTHSRAIFYLFHIGAPLLAIAACCRHIYLVPIRTMRTGWILFVVGLALWLLGMLLSAWQDLTGQVAPTVSSFSDFTYFMYGAPILLGLSSAMQDKRMPLFYWLDGIQITLAAYLTYVIIFSATPFSQDVIVPIPIERLVLTYHVENIALAVISCLMLIAHRRAGEDRQFYKTLAIFLSAYALCAGLYNSMAMAAPEGGGLLELLPALPFLLLTIWVSQPVETMQSADAEPGKKKATLFIDSFSPIFFTTALLGLGFVVMAKHFYLGMVSVFLALGVYALRATTLQNRYMLTEQALREAHDKLEQLSLTDGLTGVANRRRFDQKLESEWHSAMRHQRPLSLLMVDIDFFKSLNDEFGHPYGDACLIKIAAALRSALPRHGDLLARYGGEEFGAILPETDHAGARAVAAKMQSAVAQQNIGNAAKHAGNVTVSIGLAVCTAFEQHTSAALIAASDKGLYLAKQNGRNRIEFHVLQ